LLNYPAATVSLDWLAAGWAWETIAMAALRRSAAAIGALLWLAAAPAGAQSPAAQPLHLGVATCSGSNCHGASERPAGSAVPGNEYVIWSKHDKHRQAYTVLLEERAVRMARAVGLPDAANQKLCLDCHADNVPAAQRGRQFQLSDGVGCEACHGGAEKWLGLHISGVAHRDNLAAGLYPTEQPMARAEKCLGCHQGDATRFVDHRLYGAGHPRLGFELDTFTAIQPAHVVVDKGYIERKGRITDIEVWATGQALSVARQMKVLLDPKHARRSLFPEFALYDCQSCHHPYDPLHAPRPTDSGLGPGTVKLNDANLVMLRVAAARVAPEAARSLGAHVLALNRAMAPDQGGDPGAVQREASAIRDIAQGLVPLLAGHEFSGGDIRALAEAVIAQGQAPDGWRFSHAEQTTMAIEAIAAAMRSGGVAGTPQGEAIRKATDALYASFASEASFRPEAFAAALRDFQRTIGR
jgi:hypothetical protein